MRDRLLVLVPDRVDVLITRQCRAHQHIPSAFAQVALRHVPYRSDTEVHMRCDGLDSRHPYGLANTRVWWCVMRSGTCTYLRHPAHLPSEHWSPSLPTGVPAKEYVDPIATTIEKDQRVFQTNVRSNNVHTRV